jgi:hypothetical protein
MNFARRTVSKGVGSCCSAVRQRTIVLIEDIARVSAANSPLPVWNVAWIFAPFF